MRKRIFQVIEVAAENDKISKVYDVTMIIVIIASLFPLAFKVQTDVLRLIDNICVIIFIADYILRLITADFKLQKGRKSFALYPVTPMAIIDLLSILPSILVINQGLRLLKVIRLFRALRVIKAVRYSKNIKRLAAVFHKEKSALLTVAFLALAYILISALVIFNIEPETFDSFFDAIYWSVVSLTTVGYGDIYATSLAGKIITMVSAVFGIAIVALPAGIITAGYLAELSGDKK